MSKFPISAWAIRNPIPIAIMFIALTLAGIVSYSQLAIKQFPDISFATVVVTVVQPGAAPTELNTQVAKLVEDSVAGVEGVDEITSTVTLGVSTTVIAFDIGLDELRATDDVQTAVDGIRNTLPRGIEPPIISRVNFSDAPILTYSVAAPTMSNTELSWFVDNTISRRLQGLDGVAQISRLGGVDREVNVTVDPARLAALGVTAPQLNEALRGFVVDTSGGRSEIGGREQTVRVLGQAGTIAALRELTIPTQRGFVRLSDLAEIGDGAAEERGFARLNGVPVVAFQVVKTQESSDVRVEELVEAELEEMRAEYKDVAFTRIVSIVEDTRMNFEATQHVLLEGMILAALVVLLFLREWRATLITVIAMPASLIPTFFVMNLLGFSLNVVTLLSLTLVIGILVDDAIVEIENIQKRVEAGETPYQASITGADQIGLAVVATTLAIVAIFAPVSFMMPGVPGQFFKEFGLTVAIAVLFSLLVARFLTPLLAAYFLKPAKHPHGQRELPRFYQRLLDWTLRHRWLSLGFGFVYLLATGFIVSQLQGGFFPEEDPGYYYLNVEGPPGATRDDMEEIVQITTDGLKARPEIRDVFAQVGSTAGGDPFSGGGGGNIRNGTFTVILKENCHPVLLFFPGEWFGRCPADDHRQIDTVASRAAVRPLLRDIPDARVTTASDFGGADVQVVLASENGELLERTVERVQREMRGLDVIADVRTATPPPGPELIIRPTEEAARLGVTSEAIAAIARVATIGDVDANVAKFSEGERQLPIRVRLPQAARGDLATIANLHVPTAGGGTTPLSSVAGISFQAGPGQIDRADRERNLTINADRAPGIASGTAISAVNGLPTMKNLPAGVRQIVAGNAESEQEMQSGFLISMAAGVFITFGVMILLFRSFFKPAVILLTLPLAFGGAFFALFLTGLSITMPVLIGMLMLLGLASKNSILLVEYAIEQEREGHSRRNAIIEACRERARPIVMTTFAMMAGMLPTALGLGEGAGFRQPMAVAVIGGLISSTALSLVLVPVVYELVDQLEGWIVPRLGRLTTPRTSGEAKGKVLAPGE
ncbi:MAG: efflux RND transporter permease subunit [Proteobacteria bacterium]|nr:efflux RND transporter permease subunit [Pseudomonadota bacterium]